MVASWPQGQKPISTALPTPSALPYLVYYDVQDAYGSRAVQAVSVVAVQAALQAVLPREEALRCLEDVAGLAGLARGLDAAAATSEQAAPLMDAVQLLRLLRAACLLRPQRSYDVARAAAWARGRGQPAAAGARGGSSSIGSLPDVA